MALSPALLTSVHSALPIGHLCVLLLGNRHAGQVDVAHPPHSSGVLFPPTYYGDTE